MPRCSRSSVIINITSVFVYSQRKKESVIDFTEKPMHRDQGDVRVFSLPPILLLEQLC
jgi:hypothetical protein